MGGSEGKLPRHRRVIAVVLRLVAAAMLLGALWPQDSAYYTLLRLVVCGAVFSLFAAVEVPPEKRCWAWVLGIVALIFNPIVPVHFDREAWPFIDVGAALLLLISIFAVDRHSVSAANRKAMTVSEARYVCDIVAAELVRPGHHPVSALKGYDVVQVCIAFNLLIANEFLLLTLLANEMLRMKESYDFEKEFAEVVRLYASIPWTVMLTFVPNDQVGVRFPKHAFHHEDPRWLSQETGSSFGDYCTSIGADDPLYWQKIYTRLGLEYTSTAPSGNKYISTESDERD